MVNRMPKSPNLATLLVFLTVLFVSAFLVASFWIVRHYRLQPSQTPDTAWLDSWPDREQGLALIKAKPVGELTDSQKLSLISWLEHDTDAAQRHFTTTGKGLPEGYGEYVIDLSLTVARLRDRRALPALVKVMDISDGICEAVAEFGDDAVGPVLGQLSNPTERSSAVETLGLLLKGQHLKKNSLSPRSASQIQKQLLALTTDPSGSIRKLAVQSLAFGKPSLESLNTLRKLSVEDPYQKVRSTEGNRVIYPVREEAKATLRAWGQ
jgi:hypothetical protein